MIRRLLVIVVALLGMVWFLRRLGRQEASGRRRVRPARATGQMVRDRVCQTFLPREMALTLVRDGDTHYFCSEDCRERFLTGKIDTVSAP